MTDLFDRLARDLEDFSAETTARLIRRGRHDRASGPVVTIPRGVGSGGGGGGGGGTDPGTDPPSMVNPMEAEGDLIVGGESGGADRLGVGQDGQVLTVVDGNPTWSSPSGLVDALMLGGM